MTASTTRVALYARVSTGEQTAENQLLELRRYAEARGWTVAHEYVDHAVSGLKTSRPALDEMMRAARRRQVDLVLVWRLDRLGRSLQHLIELMEELTGLSVSFASMSEGIDLSTSAGRLQMNLLGAFAQFERERIRERIHLGLDRARKQGKRLGRRPRNQAAGEALTVRQAAGLWGCSKSQAARRLSRGEAPPAARVAA